MFHLHIPCLEFILSFISGIGYVALQTVKDDITFSLIGAAIWKHCAMGGGGGYFRDCVIRHFCTSWIMTHWETVLWIVIDVFSVRCEVLKSLNLNRE